MKLPEYVEMCIHRLEKAGFAAYAVGGCVRDALLGLIPHDYDLCTAAPPEAIKEIFQDFPLVLAGEKHGTVGVVTEHQVVEITTFRTEGTYADYRHPDRVAFVSHISEDLSRRDFTVNAMAYSPTRGLADPFGGQADLQNRVLRTVGQPEERFREDALRIIRGVRFSVRYGLGPEENTEKAMVALAPLMENLARERVFDELCKLILFITPSQMLRFAPILTQLIPELGPTVGFCQHSRFHAYDLFTHTAHTLAAAPQTLPLRWAALLHDIGKVASFTQDEAGEGHFLGHAKVSAQMAEEILRRLKAPTALRERVVFLIEKHMAPLFPERKLLRRRLSQYGEEAVFQLLQLQQADLLGTGKTGDGPDYAATEQLLREILAENACLSIKNLAVNGHDLLALGVSGPALGKLQRQLLALVVEETLPNERSALLAAAANILQGESL